MNEIEIELAIDEKTTPRSKEGWAALAYERWLKASKEHRELAESIFYDVELID